MRIAVFGATGRTGVPLVRQAVERGHEVVAFVRSPGKLPIEDPALTVVEGDVYTGEGVRRALAGTVVAPTAGEASATDESGTDGPVDAVVSVLGQTDDGPEDLLTVAGDNVIDAMHETGVERFVTLVGAGVREEGESVSLSGMVMGALLKLLAREVLADAETHVERVRASDLAWTVVRVPRLTEGVGSGEYRAGDIDLGFESIARADVARMILDCLEDERYVHESPKVGPA